MNEEEKAGSSASVPEHLAMHRGEPRSLSLIVMKSFKPSGLNEPVKRAQSCTSVWRWSGIVYGCCWHRHTVGEINMKVKMMQEEH